MRPRVPVRAAARTAAAGFVVVGVAGFVPGITPNLGELRFAGIGSALLLGVFQVSVLQNLVHLAVGIAGLLAARTAVLARRFLIAAGVLSFAFWVGGLVTGASAANLLSFDLADDYANLVVAVGLTALGLLLRDPAPEPRPAETQAVEAPAAV